MNNFFTKQIQRCSLQTRNTLRSNSIACSLVPHQQQHNEVLQKYDRRRYTEDTLAGRHKTPIVEKLWASRTTTTSTDKGRQSTEVTRTPSFSRSEIIYRFSEDPMLVDVYTNPWGYVRVGLLLEDLDAFAGNIATTHCEGQTTPDGHPLLLVTASVDKIRMIRSTDFSRDMKISGCIVWVGRSSLEIRMEVETINPKIENTDKHLNVATMKTDVWMIATFTFVSRHPVTGGPVQIPPLIPETQEEMQIFKQREDDYVLRTQKRKKEKLAPHTLSLLSWPDPEYLRLGQGLLMEGRALVDMPSLAPLNSVLVRDTKLSNAMICQRQQRNFAGRIFGGFLMRRAFELAFSTAYLFCGTHPIFYEVDQVTFNKPVNVGDLLRLDSCVLYTSKNELRNVSSIHIEVVASIVKPEEVTSFVSNTFYFTFLKHHEQQGELGSLRKVYPETLEEARRVVVRMKENKGDEF